MQVKEIIPNLNKNVRYKDSTSYTLNSGTIRKRANGEIYYLAELLDKNKRSVLIVKLEDIEQLTKNGE